MPKFKLLILDAGVVIRLHEFGVWNQVLDQCDVHLSRIVYRVLGNLGRRDQGVSLEEVLQKIGLGRKVGWQYSKAFREQYTRQGETDGIQGRGRKK
jgi:hypothetical protein